jgi:hypothetical protein
LLEFVALAALGVLLWEGLAIRKLLMVRGTKIAAIEGKLQLLERKLDDALVKLMDLDRFHPGKDDPT